MDVVIEQVTKLFEHPKDPSRTVVAVDDVSLAVQPGELVTLLGPSGCGKTTMLRMIAGFEFPTRGRILLGGKDITHTPPNKRDTAMVFQSYALFPHMTVWENVTFGLKLRRELDDAERSRRAEQVLATVGLSDLRDRSPDQLSGGQQQRVALARAIVNQPRVLLFDEPLSNLDAKLREQMRVEIRTVQQRFGITSIYVTHDQTEAMALSDRIVILREGRVEQVGTPAEVYTRPANHFVADFIGRANFVGARVIGIEPNEYVVEAGGEAHGFSRQGCGPFDVGDFVDILLRPENTYLVPAGAADPGAGGTRRLLRGTVSRRSFLGAVAEYDVEVPQQPRLTAVVTNPLAGGLFDVGDSVEVRFMPGVAHLLPRI